LKYSTFDRELLAAFAAIRHFRFVLEGRPFRLLTDHMPLSLAMHRVSTPWSARQVRQLAYISEFTTDLRHVPGKRNMVADALSRPSAAPPTQAVHKSTLKNTSPPTQAVHTSTVKNTSPPTQAVHTSTVKNTPPPTQAVHTSTVKNNSPLPAVQKSTLKIQIPIPVPIVLRIQNYWLQQCRYPPPLITQRWPNFKEVVLNVLKCATVRYFLW
jgi:hypothetical protein